MYVKVANLEINISLDGKQNVVNLRENENIAEYPVETGEPITFPCVATHPNVTISLIREGIDINNEGDPTKKTGLPEVKKKIIISVTNIRIYKYLVV